MKTNAGKQGLLYRMFSCYVRFLHNKLLYRKLYYIGTENIPPRGTPVLIVSNHQNCLCDALGVRFTFTDRKPQFIVRADIFAYHPLIEKFLRGLGLLPAYRLNFDGEAALSKNHELFKVSENELVNGAAITIFPEGTHQDKHWLGEFSSGYLKLAFEAARKSEYKSEILLLPVCNHYSGYFGVQEDLLLQYGKPVPLSPFYELFRTKPRTAQRMVNKLVREHISSMMLNITNLADYEAIDFLRNTYGVRYAEKLGLNPSHLPDKLQSDKALVAALEAAKEDATEAVEQLYADALLLKTAIRQLNISYFDFDAPPSYAALFAPTLAIVALFPLWLFSLYPAALIYYAPKIVMRRFTDMMFTNTILFAMSALLTIPLFYALSFTLAYFFFNLPTAVIYTASLPLLALFAWYYAKFAKITLRKINFRRLYKNVNLLKTKYLRRTLITKLQR